MKYVKFYHVDATTGISILKEEAKSGPVIPNIPGLDNICTNYNCQCFYGTASDEFEPEPDNNIYELTKEEYAQELTEKIELLKKDAIDRLYEDEKYLRDKKLGQYHDTATVAGIQKYQEAKEFVETGVASSFLTTEATMRGIAIDQICEKIITRYEEFRQIDSKISGLRGKILDRIQSFTIDSNDPWTSHEEWEKKDEVLVEKRIPTEKPTSDFSVSQVGTPEIVRYYSTNLYNRYQCMEYLEKYPNITVEDGYPLDQMSTGNLPPVNLAE